MGKILLFVAAAVLVWLLFKGLGKKPKDNITRADSPHGGQGDPEKMVKCDICGVFMPASESAQTDDKTTCRTPQQCLHRQSA